MPSHRINISGLEVEVLRAPASGSDMPVSSSTGILITDSNWDSTSPSWTSQGVRFSNSSEEWDTWKSTFGETSLMSAVITASNTGGTAVSAGTANRLTKYNSLGTNVEDSILTQDEQGNVQFTADRNLLPSALGTCELGTETLPFRRIRAQEVISGDHVFDNPSIGVTLRMMEHQEHLLVIRDERTGRCYKLNLTEIGPEELVCSNFQAPESCETKPKKNRKKSKKITNT